MPVFNNALAGAAGSGGTDASYKIERSLRFDDNAASNLSRTFSSGNQKKWTWSAWVKRSKLISNNYLALFTAPAGPGNDGIFFRNDAISVSYGFAGSGVECYTSSVFRDPSAWYHIVVAVDSDQSTPANRLKIWVNNQLHTLNQYPGSGQTAGINAASLHHLGLWKNGSSTNYPFDGYLADVHFIDAQQLAATDFGEPDADTGVWNPKAYSGTYGTNGFHLDFSDNSSKDALGYDAAGSNNWDVNNLNVGAVTYSDSSNYTSDASYLYATGSPFDGVTPNTKINESTGAITDSNSRGVWSDTARSYIRWDAPTPIPITSGVDFYAGAYNNAAEVATLEIYYTDGTSSSGTFTSSNNSYMGRLTGVTSGKSLDYVKVSCANACLTAIRVNGSFLDDLPASVNDSLIDTPTNYTAASGNNGGNYATLNPLDFTGGTPTLANGNLDASNSANAWGSVAATIGGLTSGKWYWEVKLGGGSGHRTGLSSVARSNTSSDQLLGSGDIALNSNDGYVYVDGTTVGSAAGNLSGKTVGIALNLDANSVSFYQNNSLIHTVSSLSSTAAWTPVHAYRYAAVDNLNFGQRSFTYTPPADHLSLCTQNLDPPTIADGSTAMDVNTYVSDGTTNKKISTNFSPDFAWFKIISQSGQWHLLADRIRGGNKTVSTNNTNDEITRSGFVNFDTDGLTVGDGNSNPGTVVTLVNYAWDAGTTTDTNNTAGSITPTGVRANPSAGFSIVSYTGNGTAGATVGHGLNTAPEWVVCKDRDDTDNWQIYHAGAQTSGAQLLTFTSAGATSNNGPWNNTAPTSSVITLGGGGTNDTGNKHIMYCWAPVSQYSAFGSYTGNGSSTGDGPFVYTGMRPRYVWLKRTDANGSWIVFDTARSLYNLTAEYLQFNSTSGEIDSGGVSGGWHIDILSNGFKVRSDGFAAQVNDTNGTWIWGAFAEHPFRTARAR